MDQSSGLKDGEVHQFIDYFDVSGLHFKLKESV